MKANVQCNDFTGTAAADTFDVLGSAGGHNLEAIGRLD